MTLRRWWIYSLIALACLVIVPAIATYAWLNHSVGIVAPIRFDIVPGTNLREAARIAATATGLWSDAFERLVVWRVPPQRLRAGTYEIAPGMSPLDIAAKFANGDRLLAQTTVVEGWTFTQLRQALATSGTVRISEPLLSDQEIMEKLGAPGMAPEGRFLPDTYHYPAGTPEFTVLRMAYAAMRDALTDAWNKREPDLPLKNADEALVLASIVEKETGVEHDRAKVAAVFVNRLRLGMKLQTDPTVIYGMGARFDGNLRRRDLEADTPYNTYVREGLPPTPIALPSRAALEAALHPAPSKALFFVSRGDGTSAFSDTLIEHNRAVQRFQLQRPLKSR